MTEGNSPEEQPRRPVRDGGHAAYARPDIDTGARPLMVYWEMTRACGLACRHCRADALPLRNPQELSTRAGELLLDRLAEFGDPLPHLVFTGGDPLQRPDLFHLLEYASKAGFKVAVTRASTDGLTAGSIAAMKSAGAWMMALSIDGSTPQRHDSLRRVPGSFDWTVRAAHHAREAGLGLQVNTLVSAETLDDIPAVYDLVAGIGVTQWALFFLVSVGRGAVLEQVSPDQGEDLMKWVYGKSQTSPFRLRTTEAP